LIIFYFHSYCYSCILINPRWGGIILLFVIFLS
jgi:hypothetical protein